MGGRCDHLLCCRRQHVFAALLAGQIVPPALVEQMRQTVPTSAGFDYGLGLVKLDLSCGPAWGHFGHIPGYATFTYHTATRHVTVSASSMPALDDDRNFNDMLRTIMVGLCTT